MELWDYSWKAFSKLWLNKEKRRKRREKKGKEIAVIEESLELNQNNKRKIIEASLKTIAKEYHSVEEKDSDNKIINSILTSISYFWWKIYNNTSDHRYFSNVISCISDP